MAINRIAVALLLIPAFGFSQNRYFVSFTDKANSAYSISNPSQFLTQKSIDRRNRENFVTNTEDLPVDTAYVRQVRMTGAKVFFTSRWFNGVLVQTDGATASSISALSCVSKVELVAPGAKLIGGRTRAKQKAEKTLQTSDIKNLYQLQMIGIDQMHEAGYHGENIDVAVFDDGFIGVNTLTGFQPLFSEGRIKAAFNFVNNTSDIYSADDHGTSTLSILAGNIPGTYLGGAYKANFFLYQTEDVSTEYRIEEYNWTFAAERADSAGVDVISSSLGYNQFDSASMDYTYQNLDGKTAIVSQAAHKAFLRGISVVNSAGNEGDNSWKYIITPADADGVIAVGSVDLYGKRSSFSSVGPSFDKRVKPDVDAMGSNTVLFTSSGCCFTGSGTSFSCPLVAGLVADLRQMLPQSSAKDIYNRVISSSSQFNSPDSLLGYGIPNFKWTAIIPMEEEEFEIYPNPVKSEMLKVIFAKPQGQSFSITIFNSAGQKVVDITDSISLANNPYPIDFSPFSSGLYYVRIKTESSWKTRKVIRIN